jgi:hypothetical protein
METSHPYGVRGPAYAWDRDIKSISDLDALAERTNADTGTTTSATSSRTDLGGAYPPVAWTVRIRASSGRVAALVNALSDAPRGKERGRAVIAMRRLTGSLSAVCDALEAVVEFATPGAVTRYVDCALWWTNQLAGSLQEALSRRTPAEQDAAAIAAVDFASLYALGHLDAMRPDTATESVDGIAALSALHEEIMWLAASLREELARD